MIIKFSFPEPLYPKAISDDEFGILGGFLSTEIRPTSEEWIPGILSSIANSTDWRLGGNAYRLEIKGDLVFITAYYVSDEDECISINSKAFLRIFNRWLAFLKDREEISFLILGDHVHALSNPQNAE